jgi:hypothetical protein
LLSNRFAKLKERSVSNACSVTISPPIWFGDSPLDPAGSGFLQPISGEVFRGRTANNIKIKALRNGRIFYDFGDTALKIPMPGDPHSFDKNSQAVMKRVALMNAHLACIYSMVAEDKKLAIDKMAISPSDLIVHSSIDASDAGFSGGMLGYEAMLGTLPSDRFDERIRSRYITIDIASLELALAKLDQVVTNNLTFAPELVEMILRGCKFYESFNFSSCLISCWAVIEKLVTVEWEKFVKQNETRVFDGETVQFLSGNRRDSLLSDNRTYSAAVRLEILSLNNGIPHDLYIDTSKVRKARNRWMHELKEVDRLDSELSTTTALKWLKETSGISLALPAALKITM